MLLAQGLCNPTIGEWLLLSLSSVEKRVSAIFTKLDLPDEPTSNRCVRAVLELLS